MVGFTAGRPKSWGSLRRSKKRDRCSSPLSWTLTKRPAIQTTKETRKKQETTSPQNWLPLSHCEDSGMARKWVRSRKTTGTIIATGGEQTALGKDRPATEQRTWTKTAFPTRASGRLEKRNLRIIPCQRSASFPLISRRSTARHTARRRRRNCMQPCARCSTAQKVRPWAGRRCLKRQAAAALRKYCNCALTRRRMNL